MDGIEALYKAFGELADAKEKISEHEEAYQAIIDGVKGSVGEKKLAASFITRFFSHFPKLQDSAIDAMLDLCEDEDNNIRRQAIKSLPDFCKDTPEHLPRIADVLTQLLQSEDPIELSIVTTSLVNLFKNDAKGTIGGLFSQILTGDETVREKAINFLRGKIMQMAPQILHKDPETERFLVEEIKKALADVTGEEFATFINILSKLKVMTGAHQDLADIVTEQAELDQPFQASDPECVDRLVSCARQALPFFQKGASSEKYFSYMMDKVFPVLDDLGMTEEGDDLKLEMLKLCAEMSSFNLPDELVKRSIEVVFNKLLKYMPLPPTEEEREEKTEETQEPKLQFSYVECLIFSVHQLGRRNPAYFTDPEASERLKDFRLRLQYFGQGCQVYIKQLRLALQGKSGATLQLEENKIKVVALKTTSNINTLIKDLFYNPPSYKATVNLSWKAQGKQVPVEMPAAPAAAVTSPTSNALEEKRKRAGITPITFDLTPEVKRPARGRGGNVTSPTGRKGFGQVYTPPGKRSNAQNGAVRGQTMPQKNQRRGRGRGRGQWYDSGSAAESNSFLKRW